MTLTVVVTSLFFAGCQRHISTSYDNSQSTIKRMHFDNTDIQYNSDYILRNLTPNMRGISKTYVEFEASEAVAVDVGDRLYQDDWRNFMLLNKPSSLSAIPVVQN